jgi:hypothetical protein
MAGVGGSRDAKREWGREGAGDADRPREKLVRVGADALGDNELVAVVLGSGQRTGAPSIWRTACSRR